jgi:hypothetical protein
MQLLREHDRTLARQRVKRLYHSERRSAIAGPVASGDRLRSVGLQLVKINVAELRRRKLNN